jgi:hypothetical protein
MMRIAAVARKERSVYYGNRCQRSGNGCRAEAPPERAARRGGGGGPHTSMTRSSFDLYLVDTLMPDLVGHDRQPSAFLVYLFLWRRTHGIGQSRVQVALTDIAENTGLSKRSVQDAIAWLARRQLLTVARASITAIPVYTVLRPWKRERRSPGT